MTLDFAPGVQETVSLALAEAQHLRSLILGTLHLLTRWLDRISRLGYNHVRVTSGES